jgi:predicted amidohydrolase
VAVRVRPAQAAERRGRCGGAARRPRAKLLSESARELGVWIAAGSVPELDGDRVFNTSLLFSPEGELKGTHRKVHLYGDAEREASPPGTG